MSVPTEALSEIVVAPEGSPVQSRGRLRVDRSGRIVDQDGWSERLRGVSISDASGWKPLFYSGETLRWLREDWGIQLVRVVVNADDGVEGDELTAEERRKVSTVVNEAVKLGLFVIVAWHKNKQPEKSMSAAKLFFNEAAATYGKHPNVMFEPFVKPAYETWAVLKTYYNDLIPAIREHSKNIIILATPSQSQGVDVAAEDAEQLGTNIVFALNFWAPTNRASLRRRVAQALGKGVALWATEWGTCDEREWGSYVDLDEARAWLDFLEEHQISDVNWAVSDKSEACSAVKPGGGQSGWSAGALTSSGSFVRADVRKSTGRATPPSTSGRRRRRR